MADHRDTLPEEAWVVALAALDGMGPSRLRALLDQCASPGAAWTAVHDGRVRPGPALAAALEPRGRDLLARWRREAADADPAARWEAHVAAGVGVVVRGGGGYPSVFDDDPDPPSVLFHLGDPDAVVGRRVAIVGTRDCTRYGYDVAFELGRELSAAGVSVVSGLALGIDGAAHAGALDVDGAPPIAVVGSGVDVVYPRRHRSLWREVARRGLLWSEYPIGATAQAWHFPARNRLIAALAHVVVIVESHPHGGALLTVDQAAARQRPVLVVPGPVRSPASAGCNALLAAATGEVGVARDVTDVLVALHLEPRAECPSVERRPRPVDEDRELLEVLGWQPATLEQLVLRSTRPIGEVAAGLARLSLDGWVRERGGWYERLAKGGG
jgi:DNA processing protein